MKKKLLAILMVGALTLGLAACSSSDSGSSEAESSGEEAASDEAAASADADAKSDGEPVSVSCIVKTEASEYWSYVVAGAKAYGEEHDDVTVDVSGATSETAYDEQQNMIETALNSGGYDAFVIAPLQADVVTTLVSGQTKPIIAVDTNIDAPEVLSFVGTSNEDAGKMGGEAAVELAKDRGWEELNAILISGVQGDTTASARAQGYQEGVEEAGGTFLANETQYADAVADKAVNCMEAIMQNHPEGVAIILANNDDMAMAACRAAEGNSAYKDTVFVGFDGIQSACNAILSGEETMSVAQQAYDMGYEAVDAAVTCARGGTVDEFIDSGCEIINEDNAQERLDTLKGYVG